VETPVILVVVLLYVWIDAAAERERIININIGVLDVRIRGIFSTAVFMSLYAPFKLFFSLHFTYQYWLASP